MQIHNNTTIPKVIIKCYAYNQEKYIRQTLDGFVMQKTNFSFVAIIHDDASPDNTAKIIAEYAAKYPEIIKPLYEIENQYSKKDGSLFRIMENAAAQYNAQYTAYCEGDDYWIDPYKLQKQVDFLESHPDYGMCYTKIKRFVQKSNRFIDEWGGPNESFEELIKENTIPTLSVLIRNDIYKAYINDIQPQNKGWLMGDYPMWLYCAIKSKIKFQNISSGVYRILQESASHTSDISKQLKYCNSVRLIQTFYANKYDSSLIKKIYYNSLLEMYRYYLLENDKEIHKECVNLIYSEETISHYIKWVLTQIIKSNLIGKIFKYYLNNKYFYASKGNLQ